MKSSDILSRLCLPDYLSDIINASPHVSVPLGRDELIALSSGGADTHIVEYDIPGNGLTREASVTRCKNGLSVNFYDEYMRRRDPGSLIVGDDGATDQPRYEDVYNRDFELLRGETFDWLKAQRLVLLPFRAGSADLCYDALLIAPENAAFFALTLADMQGSLSDRESLDCFTPRAVIFLAPPFRHTHFGGRQIVIHNRRTDVHELFSYNLYPGPSAKKGVYGILISIGESEGWITAHASAVKAVTPYDNEIVIMHEGASGGGKSEMNEQIRREEDGRVILGRSIVSGETEYLRFTEACELRPVVDDMAICHPKLQSGKRLAITDAEEGWFIRLDNIRRYGDSPEYERILIHPREPLLFLNIDTQPNSTCLPWEHILDADGTPCPNPRVILPRRLVPNVADGAVEVDVRSFGVRCPPCTSFDPSYGIIGLMHVLPPALAWLWRLVAPRGYKNPSIITAAGLQSEGVGSYWPFAAGRMIEQANLLLRQIEATPQTRYILLPNQHIGAYEVDFMPEWLAREYIARRGGVKFKPQDLAAARCSLLGYFPTAMKIEGQYIHRHFLQVETQQEVGGTAYDAGAAILTNFFKSECLKFHTSELDDIGKRILDLLYSDAPAEEYAKIL